jgi:hypothetical protein
MKVRYNLGKGIHYMHWQFKVAGGEVFYRDPKENIIKLYNCILHNNRRVADKIFLGETKDVCSWVKFQSMEILFEESVSIPSWATQLRYNPKVRPYWHDINGNNLDGLAYDELYLCSKGVFFDSCRDGVNLCRATT